MAILKDVPAPSRAMWELLQTTIKKSKAIAKKVALRPKAARVSKRKRESKTHGK